MPYDFAPLGQVPDQSEENRLAMLGGALPIMGDASFAQMGRFILEQRIREAQQERANQISQNQAIGARNFMGTYGLRDQELLDALQSGMKQGSFGDPSVLMGMRGAGTGGAGGTDLADRMTAGNPLFQRAAEAEKQINARKQMEAYQQAKYQQDIQQQNPKYGVPGGDIQGLYKMLRPDYEDYTTPQGQRARIDWRQNPVQGGTPYWDQSGVMRNGEPTRNPMAGVDVRGPIDTLKGMTENQKTGYARLNINPNSPGAERLGDLAEQIGNQAGKQPGAPSYAEGVQAAAAIGPGGIAAHNLALNNAFNRQMGLRDMPVPGSALSDQGQSYANAIQNAGLNLKERTSEVEAIGRGRGERKLAEGEYKPREGAEIWDQASGKPSGLTEGQKKDPNQYVAFGGTKVELDKDAANAVRYTDFSMAGIDRLAKVLEKTAPNGRLDIKAAKNLVQNLSSSNADLLQQRQLQRGFAVEETRAITTTGRILAGLLHSFDEVTGAGVTVPYETVMRGVLEGRTELLNLKENYLQKPRNAWTPGPNPGEKAKDYMTRVGMGGSEQQGDFIVLPGGKKMRVP